MHSKLRDKSNVNLVLPLPGPPEYSNYRVPLHPRQPVTTLQIQSIGEFMDMYSIKKFVAVC